MSNYFTGRGNLGLSPTLRHVDVDGESRVVAELRVYFDRYRPDGNDGYKEEGGFWLTVNVWGPRAEQVTRILKRGARVHVEGKLRQENWEDEHNTQRAELRLTAEYIAVDLSRVEAVSWREKREAEEAAEDAPAARIVA